MIKTAHPIHKKAAREAAEDGLCARSMSLRKKLFAGCRAFSFGTAPIRKVLYR